MGQWFEDEALWKVVEIFFLTPFGTPENTKQEVDKILKLLHANSTGAIVDLCCGQGRHSIEFAQRGFKVTGVDRNKRYLETARARAIQAGLNIEFIHSDMMNFVRLDAFDYAINFFTSFGYFENQNDDRKVLENMYQSLKPGGALIMDMAGKEVLARNYQRRDWHQVNDQYLLEDRIPDQNWEFINNRWIWLRKSGHNEFKFRFRLYSGTELRDLLLGAGFANTVLYGNLEGIPYDYNAQRLIALAYK